MVPDRHRCRQRPALSGPGEDRRPGRVHRHGQPAAVIGGQGLHRRPAAVSREAGGMAGAGAPAQAMIVLPDRSMPIKGPRASVPTVLGALHVPAGRPDAGLDHRCGKWPAFPRVTARPSGASATAGLVPWPTVAGAGQVYRRRWYSPVRKSCLGVCWGPAAASVRAASPPARVRTRTTRIRRVAGPGAARVGRLHGYAGAAAPSAISNAGSTRRRRRMDRDMTGPPCGFCVHGFAGLQAGRAGAGAGRSRLLRSGNARPGQMTARGAPPPPGCMRCPGRDCWWRRGCCRAAGRAQAGLRPPCNCRPHPPHPAL